MPRARRVEVIPVNEISSRRLQILKKDCALQSAANYDSCPLSMSSVDQILQEHLRVDLVNVPKHSVFHKFLFP